MCPWHRYALTRWLRVALLNDFEAVGYGIPVLGPHDVVPLNDVPVQPKVTGAAGREERWAGRLNSLWIRLMAPVECNQARRGLGSRWSTWRRGVERR
jgi:hypothetical protein